MKAFKFFAVLMLAVVCVGLSSCGKDDDEKNDNSLLVGTWVADDGATELTFNADGTGFEVDNEESTTDKLAIDKFTYTYDAKTMMLTMKYDELDTDGQSEFTAKIEINGDELKTSNSVYHRKK